MYRVDKFKSLLGMYVHMHWGYNHPYAARTWTLEDWKDYLKGLNALGYNLLQIWPVIDTMPFPMTDSDRVHLKKISQVIEIAHNEFGMKVYVGASANTIGNSIAKGYEFENRPYFKTERLINPANASELAYLMKARLSFLEPLAKADGFWIIDSDPGGYKGSTTDDFIQIFIEHRRLLDRLRPGIKLLYWMWAGWRGEEQFVDIDRNSPQFCWYECLKKLIDLKLEPWGVLACWKGHLKIIEELNLAERTIYFPYGGIESEPSYPMTNYNPDSIEKLFVHIKKDLYKVGTMGNAQSHCLQLPHTYFFKHFGCGGTKENSNIISFANELVPGYGKSLVDAWIALSGDSSSDMRESSLLLAKVQEENIAIKQGRFSGFLFGSPKRFLNDLILQLNLKASILELQESLKLENIPIKTTFQTTVRALEEWSKCHGFSDTYYGPFRDLFHPILEKIAPEAITAFNKELHGAFGRLLNALKEKVRDDF